MMRMSKQDFELIAKVLYANRPYSGADADAWDTWSDIVDGFAYALANTNDLFDRERFVRYCESGGYK